MRVGCRHLMSNKVKPIHRTYLSDDFNGRKAQTWAAISVGVVIIVLGIPLWWKTTEVYRAPLPFDEIQALHDDRGILIEVPVYVKAHGRNRESENALIGELESQLNDGKTDQVQFLYRIRNSMQEKLVLDKTAIHVSLKVIPDALLRVEVTNDGTVLCNIPNEQTDTIVKLSSLLRRTIKEAIVNEAVVDHMVGNIYRTAKDNKHSNELRKMVQANPKFELLFSLLCPEPDVQLAMWDMERDSELFLSALLKKLDRLFDFHVGSQVLYYTKIPYRPKVQKDDNNKPLYRFLTPQQLSLVINPIEGRLGSQVSTDPTLNFVVYVTEKKFTPLHIRKENGDLSETNAFLVPRWGSMQFYNLKNNPGPDDVVKLDPEVFMSAFIPHLRVLLGLQNNNTLDEHIKFAELNYENVADWELSYLYRLRTVEHIASSIQTLHSLSKLLNQISNIVINDNIATEVYSSVDSVSKAKAALKIGDLELALENSKKAFVASETAFFDSTLLELLYFPEDQKFAIYIPLFLPISLPILISLRYAFMRLRKKDYGESEPKSKTE